MNATRAAASGLVGTGVMTALLLVEPSVGLPKIAMGQVLSTSLGLTSAHLTIGPALGWVLHFLIGMSLALLYAAVFERRLPGTPLIRGLLYGLLVFVVAQLVFMPLVGGGVFSRGDVELLTGSLVGHLVYGGLTGWIYGGHLVAAS
ncbi:MAG TPA: DUF6789 family protein, partial [Gemmatimonadales bacterium]|nr:DUF6789 family protein [Gemmatimonadales bacterium]